MLLFSCFRSRSLLNPLVVCFPSRKSIINKSFVSFAVFLKVTPKYWRRPQCQFRPFGLRTLFGITISHGWLFWAMQQYWNSKCRGLGSDHSIDTDCFTFRCTNIKDVCHTNAIARTTFHLQKFARYSEKPISNTFNWFLFLHGFVRM